MLIGRLESWLYDDNHGRNFLSAYIVSSMLDGQTRQVDAV